MSNPNSVVETVVQVPVPVQHLPSVFKLLAELTSTPSGGAPVGEDPSVLVDDAQGVWTKSMALRLHANLHLEGARLMIDLVAKAAPEEVAMQTGVKEWGKTYGHLRAQMGALSKLTKKLFGNKTWPMHIRYNEQGQAFYSMPELVGEWWLNAGQ